MARRKNSLMSKVGNYIRRSVSITNNIKIIPEIYCCHKASRTSMSSSENSQINAIISYPNTYQYFPAVVIVVESLAIYKVPERLKKRWGYIHAPPAPSSEEMNIKQDDSTTKQQKKRWGFVAPIVGIPSEFPIFDSNPSPMKPRYYYYI